MMVGISLVEALHIITPMSDTEEEWSRLMGLVPVLRRHAEQMSESRMTNAEWFRERQSCPFLKNGRCSIYDRRPMACRTHFSTEDPSHCSPDYTDKAEVAFINPTRVLAVSASATASMQHEVGLPLYAAPLQPAVLAAIRFVQEGPACLRDLHEEHSRWTHVITDYDRNKFEEGLKP